MDAIQHLPQPADTGIGTRLSDGFIYGIICPISWRGLTGPASFLLLNGVDNVKSCIY